jgi:uncharacterized RDD family membrane protein YckC
VSTGVVYVGFWARLGATLIDTLWLMVLLAPVGALLGASSLSVEGLLERPGGASLPALLAALAGPRDLLLSVLLPAVLVLAFWIAKYATPGKMVIHARIADAGTLAPPGRIQLLVRYLGYYLAALPLGLGLLWVAFDARKRGWHDYLAGTVVVRTPPA